MLMHKMKNPHRYNKTEEVCTISLVVLMILCARLVGSVTTHWACALPAKRQPHAISIKIFFLILRWILV